MHDGSGVVGRKSGLLVTQPIVEAIWNEKYRYKGEPTIEDTYARMVKGVYAKDPRASEFAGPALEALTSRRMVPAGRIHAGAGTQKLVTMINCFVSPDIQDSMRTDPDVPGLGIMESLRDAAYTQQMGGGIGMDFSTLRPEGAVVRRTGSVATGPLWFMNMWDSMCATVKSSGSRRGAMMGTMRIDHPDILKFITAKQVKDRLTNFNVSVLVPDAFMRALEKDEMWSLHFPVPPADVYQKLVAKYGEDNIVMGHVYRPGDAEVVILDGPDRIPSFVYAKVRARELWDKIIENTYIHAEPGVIFIDRVNQFNNLYYCEHIHCTNPCGEQPLPANGDCNLGHANYAAMVDDAFENRATFNWDALRQTAAQLVRFLDNVLDVTLFPTDAQAKEAAAKRRTGIGFTGLGTALQMLGVKYGSDEAIRFAGLAARELCYSAYRASIELAKERGPFPLFRADEFLAGDFVRTLPEDIRDGIRENGLRNGVLLTVAPTGTISLVCGNVSSGVEGVFALKAARNVRQDDGSLKLFDPVYDYGYLAWCQHVGRNPLDVIDIDVPDTVNCTVEDMTVDDHINMQAAVQPYIDASISKTVNCPESMTFPEFRGVYDKAYKLGLKSCTTYRPDARSYRGQVIIKADAKAKEVLQPPEKIPMQRVLEGRRYYVKWPHAPAAFYVHINDYIAADGKRMPFEIFINSKSAEYEEWMKTATLLITGIFRRATRAEHVRFISEELKQVYSAKGGAYLNAAGDQYVLVPTGRRYVKSLIEAIALAIEEHFIWLGLIDAPNSSAVTPRGGTITVEVGPSGEVCPQCNTPGMVHKEGCASCPNCGFSNCS